MSQTHYFPPREPNRVEVIIPVVDVTMLEDRAQVVRRATIHLDQGTHKLYVANVAPVLQDVSLRAQTDGARGRVSDVSVKRAMRVKLEHKDDFWAQVEETLESMVHQFQDAQQAQYRAGEQHQKVSRMLMLGNLEVSQDVAWGTHDLEQWQKTFEQLFEKTHRLRDEALTAYYEQKDIKRTLAREIARMRQMASPQQHFTAWIELDVVVEAAGDVALEIHYTCPNAMWRPQHRASLSEDGQIAFETQAVLWQNTGEDWSKINLTCSTAKSSLGIEPPLLDDDYLNAQRKSEHLVIEAREVDIQTTGPTSRGGGGGPSGVTLPGVDDGGQIRTLNPDHPIDFPSDGDPHFVTLYTFEAPAERTYIAMPELAQHVFLRCNLDNMAPYPILAGPVELVRQSGTVGWTTTLYVAPGAPFELSYGPQDEFRIQRHTRTISDKQDPITKWHIKLTRTDIFISNMANSAHTLEIQERIPVSEIEHVKIDIEEHTSPKVDADDNGICTWTLNLNGHTNEHIQLTWQLSQSPEVTNQLNV